MAGSIRSMAILGLVGGVLALGFCPTATAQVPPDWPVVVPTPQGYTYVPPRVYRRAYRRGYVVAPQPVPYPPVAVYVAPYTVLLPQPAVYGQILVAPSVGVYRPTEARPLESSIAPSPGRQPTLAVPREEWPSGPLLTEPGQSLPEVVPPPPAEPAPYLP